MNKTDFIRNAGVLAHIDHGKSTLSDVILSEAGYISKDLAGRLLYLDFLEEEQKRGITIKTSSISLVMKAGNTEYLLNLVDTPGHVDFSGKVSRVIRLMDGAIIIVDAVEGIMAQTEAVLKLALKEWVKPILYINKLDRLITELRMSSNQIQNRLEEIIIEFNQLINNYGENEQKKWVVDVKNETVFFGSALYKWGFTTKTALEKGIKFSKIIELTLKDQEKLSKLLPLGKLVARLIFEKLPPPKIAQKYRVKKLWRNNSIPLDVINCDKKELTVIYLSKMQIETNKLLCTARVFSGEATRGEYYDLIGKEKIKINAVGLLMGSRFKVVQKIPPGNIFGFIASKAEPGITLANKLIDGYFHRPFYYTVPVIYIAITPLYPRDFDKILFELEKKHVEDPTIRFEINKDTGQILVWGVGELQLELLVKELKEKVNIYTTTPLVSFKEIPLNSVKVENDELLIELHPIKELKREIHFSENILEFENIPKDEIDNLKSIILNMLKNGPMIGEPVIGLKIRLTGKKPKEININRMIMLLTEALSKLKTEISEPYYKFEISTKSDYLGNVINEINRSGGKIEKVIGEKGSTVEIKGIIPVRNSIGLPNRIRETTKGNAYIQLMFFNYLIAEGKAREEIIAELKKRKGLY